VEKLRKLHEDPNNISDEYKAGKTIYIYKKSVRKKTDDISWAIYYHIKAKREAQEKENNGQDN